MQTSANICLLERKGVLKEYIFLDDTGKRNIYIESFQTNSCTRPLGRVHEFDLKTRDYILLTGPTKLFGNEVCKIDGGPSAKHEDRSQILQAEFPNNFVRLRSVRCFLHAAVPDVVFDGFRPLFRLKITWILDDEILDIEEEARRLTEESSPKM